jgi:hypothetical protein
VRWFERFSGGEVTLVGESSESSSTVSVPRLAGMKIVIILGPNGSLGGTAVSPDEKDVINSGR